MMIIRDYHYTWFVDSLPSAFVNRADEKSHIKFESGIPVGTFEETDIEDSTKDFFICKIYIN